MRNDQPQNPLDMRESLFSADVVEAAEAGHPNADPLLSALDRAHNVAYGVSTLLRLARNNGVEEEAGDEGLPLRPITIEALLRLGEVAAHLLHSDIERVASWAEKYGIRNGGRA